jgi:hypothetical protein
VYDDGEQEVLNLPKECWELTAERKGLKGSFETVGLFLASEFTIMLKGFFCFIHCTFMVAQANTDLRSNAVAFYLNNCSMVLIYFFMFQVSGDPTSTATQTANQ